MITKQRVTIKDIAKRAGISHQAVSYIINKKYGMVGARTREKVLDLVKEMDYIPNHQARSLKTSKSDFIGLYAPRMPADHPFFGGTQTVIGRCLDERKKKTVLLGDFNNIDEAVNLFKSGQVDGFIYFLSAGQLDLFSKAIVPVLKENDIPFVVLHGTSSIDMDYDNVGYDNVLSSCRATCRLAEKGFTTIGYVSKFREYPIPVVESIEGHLKALKDFNLYDNVQYIFDGDNVGAGYDAVVEMHKTVGAPFALNCFNGEIGLAAAKAAGELGLKIGKDIGIITGGQILVNPELEAIISGGSIEHIQQNNAERAEAAASMMIDVLENKYDQPQRVILEPGKEIRV